MKVQWFGQAAFLLTSEKGVRVICDPFNPAMGLGEITATADVITISHEHGDHNYTTGIKGNPQILRGVGLQMGKGIQFKGIASFHDKEQGSKRGHNTIFCFSLDGIRICHLGDLGHLLSKEQEAEIGKVDLLLVPTGGRATIDPAEATELVARLKPSIAVPMHYKLGNSPMPFATADDFVANKTNITRLDVGTFEVKKDKLSATTQIVVLKPSS